ncbi:DUF4232 domain-containing protein [Dactylosporangium sp. CA-139066]|uniref:DUF4232 domain-containing protein n=1 Tax=Dactylosporangium sp. CA-139066 TaxID=3239930 RepID=UPI003D93EA50
MNANRAILTLVLLMGGCDSMDSTVTAASPEPSASRASLAPSETNSDTSGRCHTGELQVSVKAAPGGGAAGSVYEWLVFTNGSQRTCTMHGFPGVSWVTGADGQQVNDPAQRMSGNAPARVTLKAGGSAHATLQSPQPMDFPDTCAPKDIAGLRVYPPDETGAVFVAAQRQVCSAKGVGLAHIGPVTTADG